VQSSTGADLSAIILTPDPARVNELRRASSPSFMKTSVKELLLRAKVAFTLPQPPLIPPRVQHCCCIIRRCGFQRETPGCCAIPSRRDRKAPGFFPPPTSSLARRSLFSSEIFASQADQGRKGVSIRGKVTFRQQEVGINRDDPPGRMRGRRLVERGAGGLMILIKTRRDANYALADTFDLISLTTRRSRFVVDSC